MKLTKNLILVLSAFVLSAFVLSAFAAEPSLKEQSATLWRDANAARREKRFDEARALQEKIRALPEREQMVIALRYYRGLTQTRAAEILGVSQVQVSRLERRAMESLRRILRN